MLTPNYGATPITGDELEALLPQARQLLDEPITKSDVYDLEQGIEEDVTATLLDEVSSGTRTLATLLSDHCLRELHRSLYGEIWQWAGAFRGRELSIGIDPAQIAVQLNASMGNIHYRWENTQDWTAHQLGIAVHAEAVRIHPFTDGNGRSTRLLANLVYVAAQVITGQVSSELMLYDFLQIDRDNYIAQLREYDKSRDAVGVASIVGVRRLSV